MSEPTTVAQKWVELGPAAEIAEGQVRTYNAGPGPVAVARRDGKLYAVQDMCSHDDGPLGAGTLDGFSIECPRHGAKFDVRDGAVLGMPAIVPIASFPVQEKDGMVQIAIPESAYADDSDDW